MKPVLEVFGQSTFKVDYLTVTEEEGRHVMFSAFVSERKSTLDQLRGKPCSITWGAGLASFTEYGYIDTLSTVADTPNDFEGTMIICLGATSVMRSGTARSFQRTTPFQIAREIVQPYRMALASDRYEAGIDAFMQTSESDWGALQRLAGVTGMSLVARGAQVRLVDVRKAIGRARLRPAVSISNPSSFVLLETDSPVGFDSYDFTGIDALGETFTVTGGDGPVKRHAPENFASLEDALLAQRRWADRKRLMSKALATYKGKAAARCGDVVIVEGDLWYVAKIKHEIDGNKGKTDSTLELHRARESRPTSADIIPKVPVALRNGKMVSWRRSEVEL